VSTLLSGSCFATQGQSIRTNCKKIAESAVTNRNMQDENLLRNGRHFNTIYRHWNETTQTLLRKLIYQQLEYQLEYWRL
jgi:hypothetical protein